MNRDKHQGVTMFLGAEVEHTPAFSKRTLFVVGKQPVGEIEKAAKEHKTPHIFMGANHSFTSESLDPYWDYVITTMLDKGYWVTLDYQAHEHESVLKMLNPGIWQCRTFVPLLSVRIPNVQTSSVNLTIKIDDIDFAATNPGVWCLHHHEITDSNRFTDWQEYNTDEIIAGTSDPVSNPGHVVVPPEPTNVYIESGSNNLPVDLAVIENSFDSTSVLNDSSLGLDTESKSQLKPDNEEKNEQSSATVSHISYEKDVENILSTVQNPQKKAKASKAK